MERFHIVSAFLMFAGVLGTRETDFLTKGRKTLHFPPSTRSNSVDQFRTVFAVSPSVSSGYEINIEEDLDLDIGLEKRSGRRKRSEDANPVDPLGRATVVRLNDSHPTLIVHWAGTGNDAIFALAKDSRLSSSSLLLSQNYGKSFTDVSSKLKVNSTTRAVIHKFYSVKSFNTIYLFTDIKHNCLFTTENTGSSFTRHCGLPFTPRVLEMNAADTGIILGHDAESYMKILYISKDFGYSWDRVMDHVTSFYWGIPPYDDQSTIYIEKEDSNGKKMIIKFDHFTRGMHSPQILLRDVVNFEVRDEYMFATRSVRLLGSAFNPNLQLWVSHRRADFVKAQFPVTYNITDFYVADASEGQMMVCVSHNSSLTNLYISEVSGYRFSLSLEKIVFFNPESDNDKTWVRFYANETFADITRIGGVNGIYVASQQINNSLEVDTQRSLISFDKGGQWQPIAPPEHTIGQAPSECSLENGCSLHITQEFHRLYASTQSSAILTEDSAPGLVIASGMLGKSLKADPDVFVSADAGINWKQVLSGNYFYAIGDHGGIIVAVHHFVPTNEVVFSIDEGETWNSYRILDEKIRIYGLLTEPGEKTTVFSVFGSPLHRHSWIIIQVDFFNAFQNKSCGASDYKMWSVNNDLSHSEGCLLGHVMEYQRRIANAVCYNGKDFVRKVETRNCSCTREDFECDFGFEQTLWESTCRPNLDIPDDSIHQVPSPCHPGTFYEYTRGYRKVSGDTCSGGVEHRLAPLLYSCPILERPEFLLVTLTERIYSMDLASGTTNTLIEGPLIRPRAVFDYSDNCLIYVENHSAIKKKCFGSNGDLWQGETIRGGHSSAHIAGIDFEWTGRNIFFTDATADKIQVVSLNGYFERDLYSSSHGVNSPQDLVVDPHHGYLFFIGANSPSKQKYSIYRAVMDGSDTKVELVANASYVTQDTKLTLDLDTERLYWVTPTTGSVYRSDIFGQDIHVLYVAYTRFSNASGIGIFRNQLYISNYNTEGIVRASKNDPTRWESTERSWNFIKGMAIVSNTSQHASSACSAYHSSCSQLCLPRPTPNVDTAAGHQNRTCLCGYGYRKSLSPGGTLDETCLCEEGERMTSNWTCEKMANESTCNADQLSCRNDRCVPLVWKCDGDDDCGDATDETDCAYSTCPEDKFTCETGQCIPLRWKCDREDDCKDSTASDEANCGNMTCSSEQFTCNNGNCIDERWVCDSENDCLDNSDEDGCFNISTCRSWEFTCDDGMCIDLSYKCNHVDDCDDGSDENSCDNASNCSSWMFACASGNQCVDLSWHCDGEADCNDGSDELNCPNSTWSYSTTAQPHCSDNYFRCDNGYCIIRGSVCDGYDNCGDNSDEVGCMNDLVTSIPHSCTPREFMCSDGRGCLPMSQRCDGDTDCHDGSDEVDCAISCTVDQFQCTTVVSGNTCIPRYWMCDGTNDCEDGSDENCSNFTECATDELKCDDLSGCVPQRKWCDGVVDCMDDSDEVDCDYPHGVNCSHFDGHRNLCCSTKLCGVYLENGYSGGRCKSNNELSTARGNKCSGVLPADSYTCQPDQFKCQDSYRACLSFVQVCDGVRECSNDLDEANCDCYPYHTFNDREFVVISRSNSSITLSFPAELDQIAFAISDPELTLANLTWLTVNVTHSWRQFQELLPATTYHFVFFEKSCVLHSMYVVTSEGEAGPPKIIGLNMAMDLEPGVPGVYIDWKAPKTPNGQITRYTIFYQEVTQQGQPVGHVEKIGKDVDLFRQRAYGSYTMRIIYGIEMNKRYQFWVAAQNSWGMGKISEKKNITSTNPRTAMNLSLSVTRKTETSVTFVWSKDPEAAAYQVTVHNDLSEVYLKHLKRSTTVVPFSYDGLCPGTQVHVGVQAIYKDNATGFVNEATARLPGSTPRMEIQSVTVTGQTTATVHYVTVAGKAKEYYIYYSSRREEDMEANLLKHTTDNGFQYDMTGLMPCTRYFVNVVATSVICPASREKMFFTAADVLAAPRNLNVDVEHSYPNYSLNLTWSASCFRFTEKVKYIIKMIVDDETEQKILTPEATTEPELSFLLPSVIRGAKLRFTVRTNLAGSQESLPTTVTIPSLPGPYNIEVIPLDEVSVIVMWKWLEDDSKTSFKEFVVNVWDGVGNFSSSTPILEKSVRLIVPRDRDLYFQVVVMSVDNSVLARSGKYKYAFFVEPKAKSSSGDDVTLSKTNLVAILVPVGVVIVLLSAGLVVFIVRHKRLQRSFLAFANSHYNIQSGVTTFSEDLDGDEPLIQGFSDDEPLVIA